MVKKSFILVIILFFSGASTLIFEIALIRKSSDIFGSTIFAVSTVTALFFLGLSLGNYLISKLHWKIQSSIKAYSLIELSTAIMIFLIPLSSFIVEFLFSKLYPFVFEHIVYLTIIRCLLISLLVLPITTLMGMTFPLFCNYFSSVRFFTNKYTSTLYGINVFGATTGTLLAGFYLIPTIGTSVSLFTSGAISVLCGLVAFFLSKNETLTITNTKNITMIVSNKLNLSLTLVLFFLGAYLTGIQIVWNRFLPLLIQNSVYSYTLLLAVLLGGTASGSLILSFFPKYKQSKKLFIVALTVSLFYTYSILHTPFSFWESSIDVQSYGSLMGILTILLLFPAMLGGILFPLSLNIISKSNKAPVTMIIGKASAINTTGSICGALFTGFILLPIIGIENSLLVLTTFAIGTTLILIFNNNQEKGSWKLAFSGIVFSTLICLYIYKPVEIPHNFLGKEDSLITVKEGLISIISVKKGFKDEPQLEINRLWQGRLKKGHQIMAAHIPMLLHTNGKTVLNIGIGTGQTAERFTYYPISQLHCVDIEQELFSIIKKYFNGNTWINNSTVKIICEDGKNYVKHSTTKYDIISVEIGQTFRPTVASFYSKEFYEDSHDNLNNDGLLCQFIPLEILSIDQIKSIIQTFIQVFPNSSLWYNHSECILIGQKETKETSWKFDKHLISSLPDVNNDLTYKYWGGKENELNNVQTLAANFLMGKRELAIFSAGGIIYEEDIPLLEYSTAKFLDTSYISLHDKIDQIKKGLSPLTQDFSNGNISKTRIYNLNTILVDRLLNDYRQSPSKKLLEKAYKLNPHHTEVIFHIAVLYARERKLEQSKQQFTKVINQDPLFSPAYENLAIVLCQTNNFNDAEMLLKKGIARIPNDLNLHNTLGEILGQTGRLVDASNVFKEILSKDPQNKRAQLNFSRAQNIIKKQ